MSLTKIDILGVPVACATYGTAIAEIDRLAKEPRPAAVSACNTHLVSTARANTGFRSVMRAFDLVLPDGTPLVWLLNSRGAKLPDRVYGPYLMKHGLESLPGRHFFFGGTPDCLERLQAAANKLNPNVQIVGIFSPPFGKWTDEQNEGFAKMIRDSGADYVWVALGGVRQESWIIDNRHRFQRGVFLAVGDAFELIAGNRPFAPSWMQRSGLTWMYRLLQEPRRLWPRYIKHNTLFLVQLFGDTVGIRASSPAPRGGIRIAFLGARGAPARYAGFETVVEQLGARLAERGHEVTVYNRSPLYTEKPPEYRGMRLIYLPTLRTKYLETIVHTSLSVLHAIWCGYDLVYVCGVGNACHAWALRLRSKVMINVDGIDYKRSKWSGFARWWLRHSERWATRLCERVIADNRQVVRHYQDQLHYEAVYIAYGAITDYAAVHSGELERWKLKPREYVLCVSRLSPENEIDMLLDAYGRSGVTLPLVVVGSHGYERGYHRKLQSLAGPNVIFTGARYGDAYRELSQNARLFVLPSAIEATRLVLLDQMGFGNAILFREAPATREVIGDAGESFESADPREALSEKLRQLANDPVRCAEIGKKAHGRAKEIFDWDRVTDQYEALFASMGFRTKRPAVPLPQPEPVHG